MTPDQTVLDCGHVGQLTGICQYQGCADKLCPDCLVSCESCNRNLCPDHQSKLDSDVYCTEHRRDQLKQQVVKKFIRRLT